MQLIPKNAIIVRLDRIEKKLDALTRQQQPAKEWYTTSEVAELLGNAEFTVREWCRLGRIYAEKRETGRGTSKTWKISAEEISRIQNEGLLLPEESRYRHVR
jgi:hypothetical protein